MIKKTTVFRIWTVAYTKIMSVFVKSTPAPVPKTKNIRGVSIGLAAIFVILAVAQLFTFEKFPQVFTQMWLPFADLASVRAAFIVTFEVLAVPFLLGMRLSPAMRVTSMVSGWLVVALWLMISLWINLTGSVVANSGFLGNTVKLPVGWWSVLFCLALGVLMAWASWGMWPLARKYKK